MARILTRPMFRKGGLSQTARPSYRGGGVTAIRPGYRGGGMNGIMSGITPRRGYADGPSLEEIIGGKKLQSGITIYDEPYIQKQFEKYKKGKMKENPFLYAFGQQSVQEKTPKDLAIMEYLETQPETAYEAFKKGELPGSRKDYATEQKKQKEQAEAAGINLGLNIEEPEKTTTENELDTSGVVDTKSQFEKYFDEYLPVIQEQLGPDSDAASRDKWLALAKFSSGVLAQPGGDLAGAVGRAAGKPLEDLSRISAEERQAKQVPKMLALQAAMNRMKGPTATDRSIDASRIDNIAKDITGRSSLTYETAYKVAEKLDNLRMSNSELAGKFNKEMPKEAKEITKIKGPKFFYTDEGDLKVVKNGTIYSLKEWQSQKEV